MTNVSATVGGTAAIQAAIAQAIKASGAIVRMEPDDFMTILSKADNPLVVMAEGGFLKSKYQYLVGYRGLVFFTRSSIPLQIDSSIEIIKVKTIWIPK